MSDGHRGHVQSSGLGLRRALVGAAIVLALGCGAAPALAATHYASTTGAASNWPCSTAATACDLQTAIEGTAASAPASGDQVIIEGGAYAVNGVQITAPVAESIQGANGTVSITSSGIGSDDAALNVGGFAQPSALVDVQVHQTGAGSWAVSSSGNTLLDGYTITAAGEPSAPTTSAHRRSSRFETASDTRRRPTRRPLMPARTIR